ncbi:MAG TPA: hypothetical protein VM141_03430 [Planctomycetota bacterium]|nr:hypothetical protein [Planctomycetota bacterium]
MFDSIIKGISGFLNSGAGFAVIWLLACAVVYLFINKLGPFHEAWKKYEGTIITGIKLAEKAVADDTPDAGLRRLDEAMKFVLARYAEQNDGSQPSAALQSELKEGIQIKHADLERFGKLKSA